MKFYSAYERPKTIPVNHGDEDYISYIEKTDKVTGKTYLVESERKNIRDYIKASFEETKIENILARAGAGDQTALNRMQGMYADLTGVPRSIAEAHAVIQNAYNEFEQLPAEMKEQFNNSPAEFIAGIGNGKVKDVLVKMTKEAPTTNNKTTQAEADPTQIQTATE